MWIRYLLGLGLVEDKSFTWPEVGGRNYFPVYLQIWKERNQASFECSEEGGSCSGYVCYVCVKWGGWGGGGGVMVVLTISGGCRGDCRGDYSGDCRGDYKWWL